MIRSDPFGLPLQSAVAHPSVIHDKQPEVITKNEAFRTNTCPCCGKRARVNVWDSGSDRETGHTWEQGWSLRCHNEACGFFYSSEDGDGDPWPESPKGS